MTYTYSIYQLFFIEDKKTTFNEKCILPTVKIKEKRIDNYPQRYPTPLGIVKNTE